MCVLASALFLFKNHTVFFLHFCLPFFTTVLLIKSTVTTLASKATTYKVQFTFKAIAFGDGAFQTEQHKHVYIFI